MIKIRPATPADYPIIEGIARQTWPDTFGSILSPEQIAYMLDWMYSPESITEQVEQKGHVFLIAQNDASEDLGYVSYEVGYKNKTTKIHKIYLLPQTQGQGIGRVLMEEVAERARAAHNLALSLNVNRQNPAVRFYERMGFSIAETVNIDIGNGYLMEDYVMVKTL